ncbi:DUF2807 domain-containing protein [Flavobacteriaceae bacterium]|nr:DUF2807 domain-containing protein [Flavobacteriaceae bacterium]MDC0118028.1 DUF2807 domain-containing protein [bacterium]
MKQLFYTLLLLMFFSCDKEDAWGCIQTAGAPVVQVLNVEAFERILVNRDIKLVVKQGHDYKVEIQTGENLLSDIEVVVVDNELQLSDRNSCNYVRDFGLTKMIVTTPALKGIRSSTQYLTSSEGVLNFESLALVSENFNSNYLSSGDFKLTIETQSLSVIANNLSSFNISGAVETLTVGFYAGLCEFKGTDLIAQHVKIFQRSSHDITVNPQQSLTVDIRSVGDVISVQRPPVVELEQYYTGQLLFLD